MALIHRHILPLMAVALLLLTSCKPVTEVPGDDFLSVHLVLNMPSTKSNVAPDFTPETAPDGNDYWIHPLDVEMLVYDAEGNFVDHAIMSRVTPTDFYNRYSLTATLTHLSRSDVENGATYRLVVLTNLSGECRVSFPYSRIPQREEELYSTLIFEYSLNNTLSHEILDSERGGRIPMWGKLTTSLRQGDYISIDLLRSVAKVKVYLSERLRAEGNTIQSVAVKHCHMQGCISPTNAAAVQATYSPQDEVNVVGQFHGDKVYLHEHPEGSGDYYIYLPEQKRGDSEMEVMIGNSVYSLRFGDYSTKELFPVVRNYYYTFKITDIQTSNDLIYQVCQWDEMSADDIIFD